MRKANSLTVKDVSIGAAQLMPGLNRCTSLFYNEKCLLRRISWKDQM